MRIPLPKFRELVEAVRAVVKGPFTTEFPAKIDSVDPNFRGIIRFRPEKCVCCGACVQVCPTNAREMLIDRERMVFRNIHHAERCIYCGQCVLYCPVGDAIHHTPEFDLARTERSADWETVVEQPAACCELCGEPFAAKPHLLHVARRVGDLVSANPTLFLSSYEELGLAVPQPPIAGRSPYRSDTMRVLCPACRRRAYVTEQWGY